MLKYHSEYDGFLFHKLFWYVELKKIGKCLFFLQLFMQKSINKSTRSVMIY